MHLSGAFLISLHTTATWLITMIFKLAVDCLNFRKKDVYNEKNKDGTKEFSAYQKLHAKRSTKIVYKKSYPFISFDMA